MIAWNDYKLEHAVINMFSGNPLTRQPILWSQESTNLQVIT